MGGRFRKSSTKTAASASYKRLGDAIHKNRKAANLSIRELAEKVDMTSAFICKVENGVCGVGVDSLIRLAKALDVKDMNVFFGKAAQ